MRKPAAKTRNTKKTVTAKDRIILKDRRVLGFGLYGDPQGLPVFAFHGTPGSRHMFQLTDAPARALGLRIIAPERPGFGGSTIQPGRTIAGWAADVTALADALKVTRFAVAGVSGGGPYAAACAALLPERVLAAAFVSPVGPVAGPEGAAKIGARHHGAFRLLPRVPPICGGLFSLGRLGFLHTPLPLYAFLMSGAGPADWKILSRREVRLNLLRGVAEGLRPGASGAIAEMRLFSQPWNLPFEAIRAPCFLWQGMADRNVPPAAALKLGELISGCNVRRLEKAGHYWIFNHLTPTLRTLRDAALEQEAALAAPPKPARRGRR